MIRRDREAIDRENQQVLFLAQALLGNVTEDLRFVAIQVDGARVRVTFTVFRDGEDVIDDVDNVIFEFEALQIDDTEVEFDVVVDKRPLSDVKLDGRLVFARKDVGVAETQ